MGRARVIVLCAAVLASVGVITISTPANAECPYFPVPPATDAARSVDSGVEFVRVIDVHDHDTGLAQAPEPGEQAVVHALG